MQLVKVLVKEKVLNILLPLCLLQAEIILATSQQSVSNVTVSHRPGSEDSFAFTISKLQNNNCSLKNPNICVTYGGIREKKDCKAKEFCCESCTCVKERPTFVVYTQRCVDDENITETSGVSKSGPRFVLDVPGSSCQTQPLTTLDTTAPGALNFTICSTTKNEYEYEYVRCTISPKNSKYLDNNGSWIAFETETRRAIKHGFSVDILQLKWKGGQQKSLQGRIVLLDVTCSSIIFLFTGQKEISVNSRLLFKTAGSQIWQRSNIFKQSNATKSTNQTSGSVIIPTVSTVSKSTMVDSTQGKDRLNVVHVSSKVDMFLVVIAAVLGTLLFMVVILGCIGVVFFITRKKKKAPLGKGANNPLYERGPDVTLAENGGVRQTSLYNSHFYQPLVENTREAFGVRGEPIYQSLDKQVRPRRTSLTRVDEQNPNRCSLAYCDMTTDGYLVPADGHTYPEPPTAKEPRENKTQDPAEESYLDLLPDKNNPEDQRLSYKYDKPEEIISESLPPLKVNASNESDSDQESNYEDVNLDPQQTLTKPFCHKLDEAKRTGKSLEEIKKHCEECNGTIGNYASGEDLKPVRCLCDVTTVL